MHATTALSSAALLALSACATTAQQDVPARLDAPSAAVHAEVLKVVQRALSNATVTLAADALTQTSTLTIGRAPLREAGRRVTGRDYDAPEHFQLVRSGNRCVLIHARTQTRYELQQAQCSAALP